MDPLGYGKITPVKNRQCLEFCSRGPCGHGKIHQFYVLYLMCHFVFVFCVLWTDDSDVFFDESQWLLASNRARSASRCLYWSKTRNGGMI